MIDDDKLLTELNKYLFNRDSSEIKKGDVDVVVNQLESIFKEYKADKSVIDYITNDLNYNELINGFGWLKTERPTPNDLVYAILSWIINFKRYNPDKGFDSSDIGNQLSIIYSMVDDDLMKKYDDWSKNYNYWKLIARICYSFDYSLFPDNIYKRYVYLNF